MVNEDFEFRFPFSFNIPVMIVFVTVIFFWLIICLIRLMKIFSFKISFLHFCDYCVHRNIFLVFSYHTFDSVDEGFE